MITLSGCCGAPVTGGFPPRVFPPYGEPRCTKCGHRVPPAPMVPARSSRSRPAWTWPGEARGRRMARRLGRQLWGREI